MNGEKGSFPPFRQPSAPRTNKAASSGGSLCKKRNMNFILQIIPVCLGKKWNYWGEKQQLALASCNS